MFPLHDSGYKGLGLLAVLNYTLPSCPTIPGTGSNPLPL